MSAMSCAFTFSGMYTVPPKNKYTHGTLSPNAWNNGRATHALSPRIDLNSSANFSEVFIIEYCEVNTAFGNAVVPDVYMIYASSCTSRVSVISLTATEAKSVSNMENTLSSGSPNDCDNVLASLATPFVSWVVP